MNGLGLLLAVAAVAVDFGWDKGPDGQLWYTIHIETELLDALRTGEQAVMSPPLDGANRDMRRFQVVMGSKSASSAPAVRPGESLRKETMVQYGWRAGKDGGLEYLVQMTPERLESLANGVPLLCEVDPQVPEIRCIYVYAGVGSVPRSGLPALNITAPLTPPFSPISDAAGPNTPSLPRRRTDGFGAEQSPILDPRSQLEQGYGSDYDARGEWRNTDYDSRRGTLPADPPGWSAGNERRNHQFGASDGRDAASWPAADNRAAPIGYEQRLAQRNDTPAPTANFAQRPPTETAARAETAPPAAPTPTGNWPTARETSPSPLWNQGSSTPAVAADVRPWTPLILTTFGLFASLGANLYLGWLAWTFFWRFRDAASDLGRSRSASSTRQAA